MHLSAFRSVLKSFQSRMPLEEEPDLVEHHKYFYEGCLGCVGVLKDWLVDALWLALKKNAETLREEHWKSTVPSDIERAQRAREIRDGEQRCH